MIIKPILHKYEERKHVVITNQNRVVIHILVFRTATVSFKTPTESWIWRPPSYKALVGSLRIPGKSAISLVACGRQRAMRQGMP